MSNPGPNTAYCPLCLTAHIDVRARPVGESASTMTHFEALCHKCGKWTDARTWLLWWQFVARKAA